MSEENKPNDVIQEPAPAVSNDPQQQQVVPPAQEGNEEFKLPTTKEEYETILKSAVNREKTNFLKELGVKSVKEYKDQVSKSEESISKYEELSKQNQEVSTKYDTLAKEYGSLKQTSTLDRLGVKEEYREDLIKLTDGKVDENNSFEAVVKNLVETKYQHMVQKPQVKIGVEKSDITPQGTSISPTLQSKYPFLK